MLPDLIIRKPGQNRNGGESHAAKNSHLVKASPTIKTNQKTKILKYQTMEEIIMAIYKIQSFANSALALSVSTSGSGNVCLLNDTGASNQRWNISSLGTKVAVQSRQNSGYLNADTSSSNCDISSTLISYVTFKKTTENVYRIQLWNNGIKYLTCDGTASGSNVSWKTNTGGANQLWALIEEPSEKELQMPEGRNCNWNQKCEAVTKLFGASACTLVAGLDVANFYSTNSAGYEPSDMYNSTYWGTSGYTWEVPGDGYINKTKITKSTVSEYLAAIKSEIVAGHPVLVTVYNSTTKEYHTVFAYGYTNGATSTADISVFDPANTKYPSSEYGRVTDLANAMTFNNRPLFSCIRYTKRKNEM